MKTTLVAIIVGSDSDLPVIASTAKILDGFDVSYRIAVASAHRTPQKVRQFIKKAENDGVQVFIAGAGMSAALPGVVAAETTCPVIGVPMEGKLLSGLDALLSIVQMPPGIPVGTVAVGKAGATNAALLAVAILALSHKDLKKKLAHYRAKQASAIEEKDAHLQKLGIHKFIEQKGS